ncbi:hypothetical protein BJV77DRAFT_357401 [Russula vinacea]|nr:hypothetical protein BJV77DRAFT_618130 [Russula vinacea]KAH9981687.1 hypothetical protein BJV77DRAFT_357401 [Russula vinacea]
MPVVLIASFIPRHDALTFRSFPCLLPPYKPPPDPTSQGGNRGNGQHRACYTRARSCINSPPFPAIQHHPRSNTYVNGMPEFRNSQSSCRASSLACTPLRTVTSNSSSPSKVTCRTASEAPRSCRAQPRSTVRRSFSLLSPFRCHVDKTSTRW